MDDIALIKVRQPFKFSNRRRPLSLPKEQNPANTTSGYVVGWGHTSEGTDQDTSNILMTMNLPIVPKDSCTNHLKKQSPSVEADGTFCAGYFDATKIRCAGDTGGPFIVDNQLMGLASVVGGDCGSAPGIYTKIDPYRKWIKEMTGIWNGGMSLVQFGNKTLMLNYWSYFGFISFAKYFTKEVFPEKWRGMINNPSGEKN